MHQRKLHLERPVWALVRVIRRVLINAIYDVGDLDLLSMAEALKDVPRRRQRQAVALC